MLLTIFLATVSCAAIIVPLHLIWLGLNSVTDEWFACIAFLVLWGYILVRIVVRLAQIKPKLLPMKEIDWPLFIYWLSMYGFCIASLIALNICKARPGYFIMGIVFMAFTLYLAAMDNRAVNGMNTK